MKIYIACPYSHPQQAVRDARVLAADKYAAKLMEQGHIVFSPLSHSHPISKHCKVDPTDHDFWLRQDLPWLEMCDEMHVLCLPGWESSRGIATESNRAASIGMIVVFVPGTFLT
jgi:hypothetical protein